MIKNANVNANIISATAIAEADHRLSSSAGLRLGLSTQGFYEMLSQGRASQKNAFNIQELIAAVDQEVDRGGRLPNEPLDNTRTQGPDPTFQKHTSTMKNLEREIGAVVSKSSRKLFNGKLVVFEDDGGRSFGLKVKESGGAGAGDRASVRQNRKYSLSNFTPTPSETVTLDDCLLDPAWAWTTSSAATEERERARLASPRPKDKRTSMTTAARKAMRQPLASLSVYGGALIYGVHPKKEANTFSKPTYSFSSGSDGRHKKYFQREIEMHGFKDEELFFQTDDSALVIIGYRRAQDGLNARKVTEVLELPEGLYPENLRISRIVNGNLVIQQVRDY